MNFRDVFTPNDHPTVTYIARDNRKLEETVRDFIETNNIVLSISGPSKSGKTVLLRNVVDEDLLIPINGVSIQCVADFWNGIFAWMETPNSVHHTSGSSRSFGGSISGDAELKMPFVGKVGLSPSANASYQGSTSSTVSVPVDPFRQIVREIGGSKYLIFIDDFHYIAREVQPDIAKIIKALAEYGVKISCASVPHRNEDVVRANSELRGRIVAVDIPEWDAEELSQIALKGFNALNVQTTAQFQSKLAAEAFGSPQLMQALCMNMCRAADLRQRLEMPSELAVAEKQFEEAMRDTSDFASFGELVRRLHTGPKIHGVERKEFNFSDKSSGDVYRAILIAMAEDPPKRSFTYEEIMSRVKAICLGESPVGSSVTGSLTHMSKIANEMNANSVALEWTDGEVLTIGDPYFAFYLRRSSKLSDLSN